MQFYGSVPGNPLVSFDHCYGESKPTVIQTFEPNVPFTLEHCLMNLDDEAGTYRLDFSSSENWDYSYFTQANEPGAEIISLVGNQVTLMMSCAFWQYLHLLWLSMIIPVRYSKSLQHQLLALILILKATAWFLVLVIILKKAILITNCIYPSSYRSESFNPLERRTPHRENSVGWFF